MEKIISFISEHFEIVILAVACLLDLVLFLLAIFRKKKSISQPMATTLVYLPNFIRKAEQKFGLGNGAQKFDYVLTTALEFYEWLSGVHVEKVSHISSEISHYIEDILNTPQKKGK